LLLLVGSDSGGGGPDLVHEPLAPVRHYFPKRRRPPVRVVKIEGSFELGQLAHARGSQSGGAAGNRQIRCFRDKKIELIGDSSDGSVIGIEIGFALGQQKATLTGLGIFDQLDGPRRVAQYGLGMARQREGFAVALSQRDRHERHCDQRRETECDQDELPRAKNTTGG
jgi:hypothetical protein